MTTLTLDGGITMTDYTHEGKFMVAFQEILKTTLQLRIEWLKELQREGVALAHPDDGWVDRINNKITFAYPDILNISEIKVGGLACLGTPKDYRIVKLTERLSWRFCLSNRPVWENCWWAFRTVSRTIDRRRSDLY